jgi:monoamine oxidase
MHKPGFLSGALGGFHSGEGRIRFAGADYARGWGGFIDGAIEGGLVEARRIVTECTAAGERQLAISA